jgi:hypothetical protein
MAVPDTKDFLLLLVIVLLILVGGDLYSKEHDQD